MKKWILLSLALSIGCASNDDTKDVVGILKSTSAQVPISASAPPAISVSGRNAEEFAPEYTTADLNTPLAHFIVRGVPTKQPVVFRVTGSTVDAAISFPLDVTKLSTITLPAVEPGTKQAVITQIQALGTSVDQTAGMIIGQIDTTGLNCASIKSVAIKSKDTGQGVTVGGPFYFDIHGNVTNSGTMQDSECSYVIVNVLPGNYILDFLDSHD